MKPTSASADGETARKALMEAWRESVQYRSAHLALARNVPGLEQDLVKAARMLDAVGAAAACPVVGDLEADRAAVEQAIRVWLDSLGVKGVAIDISTPPPPPSKPAKVSTTAGLVYAHRDLGGFHRVRLTIPNGFIHGKTVIERRAALVRYLIADTIEIDPAGRAVVDARVPFFYDLEPVELQRPMVDPDVVIAKATGQPADALVGALAERATKVRDNYAKVEAAASDIRKALGLTARFRIESGRFGFFTEVDGQYRKTTWMGLISQSGDAKKPGHEH